MPTSKAPTVAVTTLTPNPLGVNLLRIKEQWRLEGVCLKCGKSRTDRGLFCWYHRKYHREQVANRRKQRIKLGICTQCGLAPIARAALCQPHYNKMRERLARAYEQGKIPL